MGPCTSGLYSQNQDRSPEPRPDLGDSLPSGDIKRFGNNKAKSFKETVWAIYEKRKEQIEFDKLCVSLRAHGKFWEPNGVYVKPEGQLGDVTKKTLKTSMNAQELCDLEQMINEHFPRNKEHKEKLWELLRETMQHKDLWELMDVTKAKASETGKSVQLPYLFVLYASTWNVKLEDGKEVLHVPFLDIEFRGKPQENDKKKFETKAKLRDQQCIHRGWHHGKCATCDIEMSQLSGAMTSALVDGFSGPMEIAITSCVGLPRTWNFTAGLAETCGLCFCCYFLPHNMQWFEVWAANVLRDALVGKSTQMRFAVAVVYDGGQVGNWMQQMELPFTYLYDLPVLLLESSELRNVFIETKLMQREIEFVTGSEDQTVRMWNARGNNLGMVTVGSKVTCLDITHDWLFAGDKKGHVYKFSRFDKDCSVSNQIHSMEVMSLTVARQFVFTSSNDRTIKISGIQNLEHIHKFQDDGGLGRVLCVTVGIEFYFAGGGHGSLRLSHVNRAAEATPIESEAGKLTDISLMALNGHSLFMASRGEDTPGELYFLHNVEDAALRAEVVFTANEEVRSLALGGKELFVATKAVVYKLDAGEPWKGPFFAINVAPLQMPESSKVWVLKVYGEIAVVVYFLGSKELGLFNTRSGGRIKLKEDAFKGHDQDKYIECIGIG